jgi:hypothetical protein
MFLLSMKACRRRFSIGSLTFLAGSFRQMRGLLEGILTALPAYRKALLPARFF